MFERVGSLLIFMSERDFKVLRCSSMLELNLLLQEYKIDGWKPIGGTEVFEGEFVQPIKITFDLDDTEEITQEVIQENIEK